MSKLLKCTTAFLLMLLASTAILLVIIPTISAQDDEEIVPPPIPDIPRPPVQEVAKVIIIASVGGTTEPAYGEYTYPNNTKFEIKANPNAGYKFSHWVISGEYLPGHNLPPAIVPSGEVPEDWIPKFPNPSTLQYDSLITSQNPLSVICGYGYTYQYQPVFVPTAAPSPGVNTFVTLIEVLGGTSLVKGPGGSTNSAPGTYAFGSGQGLSLEAIPAEGFDFSYWIAKGPGDPHPVAVVDNPVDINCQEGTAYEYQPVFVEEGQTVTGGGIPAEYLYAIIIILVILAAIGFGGMIMYRGKGKGSQ